MTFLDLKGRKKTLKNARKYAIDWHKKTRSKFQDEAKRFFYPYWKGQLVFEELRIPGTRLTLDFYNHTRKIAAEIDGIQHQKYVKYFHGSRVTKWLGQVKRDLFKEDFLEANEITLIRIQDVKELTYEFFLAQGIEL